MSEIHPSAIAVGRALVHLLPLACVGARDLQFTIIPQEAARFLRDPATLHWADGMDQHGYTAGLRDALDTFISFTTPEPVDNANPKH